MKAKLLQIQWLDFSITSKFFHHCIVEAVAFATNTLQDAIFPEHTLILVGIVSPGQSVKLDLSHTV